MVQNLGDEWLGATSRLLSGDTYDCPPYLRRIVFNVHFSLPHGRVVVRDPAGRPVPPAASDPDPGTFVRLVVDDPEPGTYRIERQSPSLAYTTFVEEYRADVARLSPVGGTPRDREVPLTFRATRHAGTPLLPLPAWPLEAFAIVRPPSGTAAELPATVEADGRFRASWRPTERGDHTVGLRAVARRSDGTTFDVFGTDVLDVGSPIAVGTEEIVSLRFSAIDPAAGMSVLPWADEVALRFALVDGSGEHPLDAATVVTDPSGWLTLERIHTSGVALGDPIPLAYENGTFVAHLPVALRNLTGVIVLPDVYTGTYGITRARAYSPCFGSSSASRTSG